MSQRQRNWYSIVLDLALGTFTIKVEMPCPC